MMVFKKYIFTIWAVLILGIFFVISTPALADIAIKPVPVSTDANDPKVTDQWKQPQPDKTTIPYGMYDGKKVFYRSSGTAELPTGWYFEDVFNDWLKQNPNVGGTVPQAQSDSEPLEPINIPNYAPGRWEDVVQNIITILLVLIGVVATVVLIYGGYLYITSAGNPEIANKGKNAILGAVIGIIIAFSSYLIVNFILK